MIICIKLNESLETNVKNLAYDKALTKFFTKKGFSSKQIELLYKVKFWKVQTSNNHLIVYSLFNELLNIWLPQDELEKTVNSILLEKIYDGSEIGSMFTKSEILEQIATIRDNAIKNSGHFDKDKVQLENQLSNIAQALQNNKSPVWAPNQLSSLSSQPSLMFYIFRKLLDKKIDNLEAWDELWKLNRVYGFSFRIFDIFKSNLHTKQNLKYVLKFIKENISRISVFYREDYLELEISQIIKEITLHSNKFIKNAFEICKQLLQENSDEYFFIKRRDARDLFHKREMIAEILNDIYYKADRKLQTDVYYLIILNFNLVEDQVMSRSDIATILSNLILNYLTKDWDKFEKRLLELKDELIVQFDREHKKNMVKK